MQRGDAVADSEQNREAFQRYMSQTIERRRQPQTDLLTALVMAHDAQDRITVPDILNTIVLFMVAGNEENDRIGNGVLALLTHPEQGHKLRENPALAESMTEEVLRFDAPVQMTFQTTTQDVELGGVTIPADCKVALLFHSHPPKAISGVLSHSKHEVSSNGRCYKSRLTM